MNILFVVHYPELYGSIRSLLDLVLGLESSGIIPYFIVPAEGSLSESLAHQGIRYEILDGESWVSEKPVPIKEKVNLVFRLIRNSRQIDDYVKHWQIDLLYTNTFVTPAGLFAARQSHLPHIWHVREFGDLDFGLRFIYPNAMCKAFMRQSDAIICHSKVVRNYHFRPDVENVHQIYNGVALKDQFDARLALRQQFLQERPYTFIMMSSITPNKGQEVALRALAELCDKGVFARLVIGGSGKADYLEYLASLISELGLDAQVEFIGFTKDPFPNYYSADCALICSENEAFSRVGLEAMSTALPLIGKNSGGNPEIIVDGETGLFYNTLDELVEAMCKLAQNPSLSRQMGLAGWQRARDLFNIEDYAANVYRVIQSVMERR